MKRTARSLASIVLLGAGLAGCGGGATIGSSGGGGVGSGSGGGTIPIVTSSTSPVAGATPTAASATPTATPTNAATSAPNVQTTVPAGLSSDAPALATTSGQTFGSGAACTTAFNVSSGGYSSCNMRWVSHIQLPPSTIGGHYIAANNTYYVSSFAEGLYSFDVANPENVTQTGHLQLALSDVTALPLESETENEDTGTNGKIAILSRSEFEDSVVIDVHDPANMSVITTIPGGNGHTQNCLDDCAWDYTSFNQSDNEFSSGAHIVNLQNPAKPVLSAMNWNSVIGNINVHDVTEIAPGLIFTASNPASLIDVSSPLAPKLVMTIPKTPDESTAFASLSTGGHIGHSVKWPQSGRDRFFFGQSEANYNGRCELFPDDGRTLYSYDTTGWQTTHQFSLVGSYTLVTGNGDESVAGGATEIDSHGNPSVAGTVVEACSTHWFDVHPNFANGGLIALSSFDHGVRMLNVASNGQIQQIGYFVPVGSPTGMPDTVGVHWISQRYLATIDFENGGLDIIEYTGPLPVTGPLPTTGVEAATRGKRS